MNYIFWIGIVAAVLTTSAFLPQVIKAYKTKHTKDISFMMCIVLSVGLILWLVYGILLFSLPIILANSVTLLLIGYLIYLKIKYG
ncbi:hypothetical protein A2526_06035 [candidate division WOR-1 bacterium RIFOXYD2_FULL_36_8]|uniref:MtN3 and saliva related transmembrane protein n=1 Tax=candidate division WOR-1 bacterium RIFOXYB2_FULL_36_35 TaxID=1802578 RepID=A0A1F4S5X1_UNCSA|nr:MAG: hypothetical protein A2230_05030 [candidate division WOR-1 bacterium RIFOXYA2_FULL_36_21]OGC15767.1 MAG: hypothetical protein A2290_05455 [candidate division WOR-1 bacterium RIFOXYB2_FULL_36_35]OGC21122.1 MAG: hypothetical protein A2282_03785 [candidate division WOR-1 bacterium RIFOXYA12_FULL_36_13]OGC39033.1 MAG: hypothetical protein A2526_06035 [candidate division WOR-1 bacterium RIFOXYD2_FULL_36_8]